MKASAVPLIGKVTVIKETPTSILIQVDVEEALFSIIYMKNTKLYLDKTTLQPYRSRKSSLGSYTSVFITRDSFKTGKTIIITLLHFHDTGQFSVGYVLKK